MHIYPSWTINNLLCFFSHPIHYIRRDNDHLWIGIECCPYGKEPRATKDSLLILRSSLVVGLLLSCFPGYLRRRTIRPLRDEDPCCLLHLILTCSTIALMPVYWMQGWGESVILVRPTLLLVSEAPRWWGRAVGVGLSWSTDQLLTLLSLDRNLPTTIQYAYRPPPTHRPGICLRAYYQIPCWFTRPSRVHRVLPPHARRCGAGRDYALLLGFVFERQRTGRGSAPAGTREDAYCLQGIKYAYFSLLLRARRVSCGCWQFM